MSYIKKLYDDLQDEAAQYDFICQVLYDGVTIAVGVLGFKYIDSDEKGKDSIQLKIFTDSKPAWEPVIVVSFTDYDVKYYEEGDVVYKNGPDVRVSTTPSPRIFKVKNNYLRYMAEHYAGYVEDCKDNTITQKEKEKQTELDYLEGVFSAVDTNNL